MSFPTNPTNGQIYKNYQYNSINQTWNTISTKNNIQKTGYFNTGDIRELCRIPFTNLGACVRVTLFATRGDYVAVATWLITTGHASGCQITKQNGTYIVPSTMKELFILRPTQDIQDIYHRNIKLKITKKNLIKKSTDSSRKYMKYRNLTFDIPCLVVQEKQRPGSFSEVSIIFCDPKEWPSFRGNSIFSTDAVKLNNPIGPESLDSIIYLINQLLNTHKYKIMRSCFE